jgi:sporulation protein YlmC with PRC-barrel domain
MLRSIKEVLGIRLLTDEGIIGKVQDFYFNYEDWTIRYLVIKTGPWIFGRKVSIPTTKLGSPDLKSRLIPVSLTKEQIENDVSYNAETLITPQQDYLRPISEVIEYQVYGEDGGIGEVDDFIFEEHETWLIRSLVVKMRERLFSKKVVIASFFVELISFGKSATYINLIKDTIENSPEFDREEHINKELETSSYPGPAVNLSRPYKQGDK